MVMKLRNKKTGEIVELDHISVYYSRHYDYGEGKSGEQPCSTWDKTLAELNEEWEDYEEPKKYWYIDYDCGILCGETDNSLAEKMMISMGNHFDSSEEAEKAVEKLKAWKRLKDKGFMLGRWRFSDSAVRGRIIIDGNLVPGIVDDLDLLFGGEK